MRKLFLYALNETLGYLPGPWSVDLRKLRTGDGLKYVGSIVLVHWTRLAVNDWQALSYVSMILRRPWEVCVTRHQPQTRCSRSERFSLVWCTRWDNWVTFCYLSAGTVWHPTDRLASAGASAALIGVTILNYISLSRLMWEENETIIRKRISK